MRSARSCARSATRRDADALIRLTDGLGLDAWAADNVLRYIREQAEAGGAVPDDRTIVVERFRDEIGDWRVCVLTPFGARVHAPWAIAMRARLDERLGMPVEVMWADDGIVLRLPEAVDHLPLDELTIDAGGDRRPGRLDAAHVVALRVEVPRVRGALVAAPAPPAR